MLFTDLDLNGSIQQALKDQGYINPTPIQATAIPLILQGKDIMGSAQTGTGKTAAFALPILNMLAEPDFNSLNRGIRALILAPTRELVTQIADNFNAYSKGTDIKSVVIFGGVPQRKQTDALKKGVDVVIATPGRLLDLINQGYVKLNAIQFFVLDEADRMLDMGFINDIRKIAGQIPAGRQTLFFSATMSPDVQKLSSSILRNPVKVEVAPASSTGENIKQSVYYVEKNHKRSLLIHLLDELEMDQVIVFTRTKHTADRVALDLKRSGIGVDAIHGNKSQSERQKALANFKRKHIRVLVATDIAARGLDISDLNFVINYELPDDPESYVHRIGRTGRAGNSGIAMSFCGAEERSTLQSINKLIKKKIEVEESHPYISDIPLIETQNRNSVVWDGRRVQRSNSRYGRRF